MIGLVLLKFLALRDGEAEQQVDELAWIDTVPSMVTFNDALRTLLAPFSILSLLMEFSVSVSIGTKVSALPVLSPYLLLSLVERGRERPGRRQTAR